MEKHELKRRVEILRHMHEIMRLMNDEGAYFEWIGACVPDEPCDEDFESIAEDAYYEETLSSFEAIFNYYKENEV